MSGGTAEDLLTHGCDALLGLFGKCFGGNQMFVVVEQVELVKHGAAFAGDVHGGAWFFINLTIDKRGTPEAEAHLFIADVDNLFPIYRAATVAVQTDVRVLTRLFEVVAGNVAGGNGLQKRPTRSTQVQGRVNLQRTKLFHAESGQDGIDEAASPWLHLVLIQWLLEVCVENEDLVV